MNFRLPETLKVCENVYESAEMGKTMFMNRIVNQGGNKVLKSLKQKLTVTEAASFSLTKDVFCPKNYVRHKSAFPKIEARRLELKRQSNLEV